MPIVYIASKYEKSGLNRYVEGRMLDEGWTVFLPEHIGVKANSVLSRKYVTEECVKGLASCNVLIAIGPFGRDVACEIGIAYHARLKGQPFLLVRWNTTEETSESDDLISTMFDFESSSLDAVIRYIRGNQPYSDAEFAFDIGARTD